MPKNKNIATRSSTCHPGWIFPLRPELPTFGNQLTQARNGGVPTKGMNSRNLTIRVGGFKHCVYPGSPADQTKVPSQPLGWCKSRRMFLDKHWVYAIPCSAPKWNNTLHMSHCTNTVCSTWPVVSIVFFFACCHSFNEGWKKHNKKQNTGVWWSILSWDTCVEYKEPGCT